MAGTNVFAPSLLGGAPMLRAPEERKKTNVVVVARDDEWHDDSNPLRHIPL